MTASPESPAPPGPPDGFRAEGPGFVLAWGAPSDTQLPLLASGAVAPLREQTAYPVLLRATGREPVALLARDPVLLGGLRSADDGRVVFGSVGFGGQVGRATLEVAVGGRIARRVEVEVVPTKLDYRTDFAALVEDTRELLAGLVVEHLRATWHGAEAVPRQQAARLEWLALLRHAAGELERALEQVARHPRWGLAREEAPTRAERVRRADAGLHRALRRGAGAGAALEVGGGRTVRERVPERRGRPTLDTPEHRWLAARVRGIQRTLAGLLVEVDAGRPAPRLLRLRGEVEALAERVDRLSRLEPLAAAQGEPPPGFASLQLLQAPGYREAHRACLLLAGGLRVQGGPVELSVRDLHQLYEQWCYLALVRLASRVAGRPLPMLELLAETRDGLRVRLRRGREHAVGLPLDGGGTAALVYNPGFGGEGLLVPQRPDVLLEVRRPGRDPVRVVLDAKYRLDPSPEYAARYGAPGPPEEALNTLHRYRDALGVGTAVALYPASGDAVREFGASRLWRAVGRIGVGALPFLPGETRWVEEWLRELLARG